MFGESEGSLGWATRVAEEEGGNGEVWTKLWLERKERELFDLVLENVVLDPGEKHHVVWENLGATELLNQHTFPAHAIDQLLYC